MWITDQRLGNKSVKYKENDLTTDGIHICKRGLMVFMLCAT